MTPAKLPSLTNPRRITLTIREYYQQYTLPLIVSFHRCYLIDHDLEVVKVKIIPNGGTIIHFYRVHFNDESTLTITKDHQCVVEILPGIIKNR